MSEAAFPAGPARRALCALVGVIWIIFQIYVLIYPQQPLVERPLHLVLALTALWLWFPLKSSSWWARAIDFGLLGSTLAAAVYYFVSAERLTNRMEGIDPVLPQDVVFGILILVALLEGVRRAVGWSLLGVLFAFLAYAVIGPWIPGWLGFSGFSGSELIEILSMSLNGVLGITTETSLQFVFYFILFGAVYSAVGGGQLFIDIGLRLSGRKKGGAAKAAVLASSMMGSITGSAVANVTATGVFTIPLMRRAGYSGETAAAVEALASTGGQLMPPVMGVAAFVVAEMLQIPYAQVAMAGLIPALAFYVSIFLLVDLEARKTGVGTLRDAASISTVPILPRLYLLSPPVVMVALLAMGYSASLAAVISTVVCLLCGLVSRERLTRWLEWRELVEDTTRQACHVAVPIAAIGMIIAVAIQSNLALKFSSHLIGEGGGSLIGAMLLIVVGCLIMGMGLPTVAAYIIGAILFAPALLKLGIPELAAHFFVMYYCVLSMVTPPVALASYAAAGIAGASTMSTSVQAFRMSFVSFLIPFAFAFDPRLLGDHGWGWAFVGLISLVAGTSGWAVGLAGFLRHKLRMWERVVFAALGVGVIVFPTGKLGWIAFLVALAAFGGWAWFGGAARASGQASRAVSQGGS